jgi:hypothetical protein
MNDNWFMTQQDDYINDISSITDSESFLNFIRIAFDTNPIEMCLGAVFIIVVSIYINKKTSKFVKAYVSKYIETRM